MTAAEYREMMRLGGSDFGPRKQEAKASIRMPKINAPNKTEAEFMRIAELQCRNSECEVRYEPFTLRLPSGTRYTPDVVVMKGDRVIAVCEVKGPHIHNAASIRAFKEAAASFPGWDFFFCQLTKNGWATEPKKIWEKIAGRI